jgi:D-aminopeptidase
MPDGSARPRARDLGIVIGSLPPGPRNAITDVAGVRVGHATIVRGDGPLRVGEGPVRTGVTLILPSANPWTAPVFAGAHRLNGNGEMTGLEWIRESGLLASPIGITNTHSVGLVRDALVALERRTAAAERTPPPAWLLPVVAETWDGLLNDIDGFHVRPPDVEAAWNAAVGDTGAGPVVEGNVGGGTGMICHGFKGGIGSASRIVELGGEPFTLGVLVQANHGHRSRLAIDGVPLGRRIGPDVVPLPRLPSVEPGAGSIIVIVATDAPLLPHQCTRLAQRPALGIGRVGGAGEPSSGDLILAFATGNAGIEGPAGGEPGEGAASYRVRALRDAQLRELFWAAIEATEEAIVNALVVAETMTGRDGITAHALPHDLVREAMRGARPGT